jgi:hypothetical protein
MLHSREVVGGQDNKVKKSVWEDGNGMG